MFLSQHFVDSMKKKITRNNPKSKSFGSRAQKSPQISQKVWNKYGKGGGDCLRPSYSRASFQKKIRTQRHLNETNFGHNFDVRAKSS